MTTPTLSDLLRSLPRTFLLCCREVTLSRRDATTLDVSIDDVVHDADALAGRVEGILISPTDAKVLAYADKSELKAFLRFFLRAPIGPEMILESDAVTGSRQQLRHMHMNFAFQAWRFLKGKKDKNGRLKRGMLCIAFSEVYNDEYCSNVTRSPDGICHVHQHHDARTFFNHFPKKAGS